MNAATLSGSDATRSMTPAMHASRVLGWVSFALGAAELLAPKQVASAVGMNEGHSGLLRAYGAREVMAGVGALSVSPVPAMWSRVAGDMMDLATLALASRRQEGGRDRAAWIAMAAVLGIAVVDALVAARLTEDKRPSKGEPKDYSARSGFPGGIEAARGAGIVRDAFAGKAGGAAAGDSSPAGRNLSGQTSTDLNGAADGQGGRSGRRDEGGKDGGLIGGGRTMPQESEAAVPKVPGYTPA